MLLRKTNIWLSLHRPASSIPVTIGKIDLQGPMSGKTMKKVLLKPDEVLQDLPYFTFKGHYQSNFSSPDTVQLTDGTPILLSRTGYTGEFGFEIFVDPLHLVKVWEMLLDKKANKVPGRH
jgi:aminomethyltransferase